MKILISGSSGLIGSALVAFLNAEGHEPICLTRKNAVVGLPMWDPECGVVDLAGAGGIDAVVHLAGDSIARGRWNAKRRSRILDSRVRGTKLLAEFFAASDYRPRVMVSASAVGIYGNRGEELIDEASELGSGFLANVCKHWERATSVASNADIRVVHLRFGVVLSPAGGLLKKVLTPFRLGLGGIIGSGKQFMSWVSIDDVTRVIQHVIVDDSVEGPVNLVAPNAVTNREFTKTLGRILHRPTILPVPAFAARMAFGQMAEDLLLASVRVAPVKLLESGYEFQQPEFGAAVRHLLSPADGVSTF